MFKQSVLNRVAPLFFGPRLSRVIRLKGVGLQAQELLIPLGNENWESLNPQIRDYFVQKVVNLSRKQGIESLGVTRNLEPGTLESMTTQRRGDSFIIALALLRIGEGLEKIRGRRVILVSDQKLAFPLAVISSERFKVPVFLQSINPRQHEATAMRMLRQEGLAIALSKLSPGKWADDDIVILLDENYQDWGNADYKGVRINLFDSSRGHAPELEAELQQQGINPALCNLAPLLEAHILNGTNCNPQDNVEIIKGKGGRIWDYFLDNDGTGHYNTIKGF